MSADSSPQQHEGERGNTIDAVADLLLQEEPTVEVEEEKAVHRPNDDDLVDDSEESEVIEAQESDDEVEDPETDDSNELETDDDDGLAALAAELGLDADKLTLFHAALFTILVQQARDDAERQLVDGRVGWCAEQDPWLGGAQKQG